MFDPPSSHQQALQLEEQLLFHAHLAQSISDAVISTDLQYCIFSWNDAAEGLYGWKREEVMGKYSPAIVPTSFPDPSDKDWLTCILTKGFWKGEVYQKRKDGSSLAILASVSAVKDFSGNILGFVTVNRDITASKQAMEQLRQSEQRFRLLAEHAPDIIARFDRELRHLYINPAVVKATGIAAEVYIGKTNRELGMPEDLVASWDTDLHTVFETGQQQTLEFSFPSPTGIKHYQTLLVPEYDAHGSIMSVLSLSRDMTDLKALEKHKDDFIIMASHELKTPVTSVVAFAELLQVLCEQEGNAKYLVYLSQMNTQLARLTRLINDVLDLSKIQEGKLALQKTFVDLNALVKETVEALQLTTQKHRLQVVGEVTAKVWADQDRIGQVLTNLLTNAIRYSPEPGNILVRLSEEENSVTLAVQDFGIGIPRDHQAKIFERYYRVGGTKENTFPGLGMGLYISRELVRQHGGCIWVDSTTGKGSTFSFSLPLKEKGSAKPGEIGNQIHERPQEIDPRR